MRNNQIIAYVTSHPGISSSELSELLGVSDRTVRKSINALNASLGECAAIRFKRDGEAGSGYYLIVDDKSAYQNWMIRNARARSDALPESQEERVRFILDDLLVRTDWVTREQLSAILFVSPASITAALKDVERILGQFDLELERRPRYGMRVSGSEMNRRLCWANVVVAFSGDSPVGDSSSALSLLQQDNLHAILVAVDRCVSGVLSETGFSVSSFSYKNLLVHIGISIIRIQNSCYIPMTAEQLKMQEGTAEYGVAQKIASAITECMSICLPKEEVAYIAIHLAGKQVIAADEGRGESIPSEIWDSVSEILDSVWNAFRYDLRGDLTLRAHLAQHIVPLAVRMKYHFNAQNPMTEEIKERYPLAYSMALEASGVLVRHFGGSLSEDEIGYLALSFALSLEQQKNGPSKKSILIVCASGKGSARLLEYRFRREFENYLDRIETCDARCFDQMDLDGIDYVFTTAPLEREVQVPVFEVSLFLDEHDLLKVRHVFQRDEANLLHYLDYDLFLPHLACTEKDAVLSTMCDAVLSARSVDPRFPALVREREQAAPTAFGGLVALPHPIVPASDESFVCVALLDCPVVWSGHEVRAVFMLSIAREPDADLDVFYDFFSDLMFDSEAISRLLEDQRFETLQSLFLQKGTGVRRSAG